MLKLSEYEKNVLRGSEGKLKQVAMENVVRYAKVLGAKELCEVTKATVFCGAHNYLEILEINDFDEVFSKINLGKDEVIPFDSVYGNCYTQSCVSPCDQYEHEPFNQAKDFFDKNTAYLEAAKKAGVSIAGTCAPYLTGWLPIKGEHYVTTESGVTVIGNSLFAAMGNSDGIEAAFWSAICGRTPKWGKHLEENRVGTHLFKINTELNSVLEWDLLGKAIGDKVPTSTTPVIEGAFKSVDFSKLKHLCTTLAVASNCEMCHVVGITPEARTREDAFRGKTPIKEFTINKDDLAKAYNSICDEGSGEVQFVSLGCPHYDLQQIKEVADYLNGKKVHENVHLMIWTVYPIKFMADENGYTKIIEEAGGHIYTSTCPTTIGPIFLDKYSGFVFDSLKQCYSVKSDVNSSVYLGNKYSCIDAAVTGSWEANNRWIK